MAEQLGYYWKNQLYAELSKRARERIRSDQDHWDTVSDGKWEEAIGYSHPINYYGGVNEGVVMLTDDRYATVASLAEGVGANAEGQEVPGSGTLRFKSASPDDERFFDVFSRNRVGEEWLAEIDAPWITLSDDAGTTATEQRVIVTVDWPRLDASASGTIRVYNAPGGARTGSAIATFTVQAVRSAVDLGATRGHLEANGYVAIEAETTPEGPMRRRECRGHAAPKRTRAPPRNGTARSGSGWRPRAAGRWRSSVTTCRSSSDRCPTRST